ncbi:MAG: WD40/YVTN/BNR-like repeat-containing protein, partial [Bacteroidales bacterium]
MLVKKASITLLLTGLLLISQAQEVDMDLFHGIKPRNIGPAGMSGRVTAIAVDNKNTEVFYVGTASGGLWKTSSGGIDFEPVFDDQKVASIGALAIDPLRPDIIWAGTGEGNPRNSVTGGYGIYKSLDAGKTWELKGLEETRHIHRILVNPDNSDIVYAGAIGSPWGPNKERGLYRSTNGGDTWEQILFTNNRSGVADMVMDPDNPDKILVAMWDHQRWPWFFTSASEGSGLYLSLDGGDSFEKITEGLPEKTGRMGLSIARSRPDYIYAYVESETNAIYRSTDGGFSWEKRGTENIGGRPFYYAEIHVDPSNENRLYTLYSRVRMSEDGGLTFPQEIAASVHLDHHAWWINPDNPKHMIDGNDGGLAVTWDMGKTWRHITNLPLGQFYHIAVD